MKVKKIGLGMISAALVLAAGCSSAHSSNTGGQEQSSSQKVELRFSWWGSQERHNRTLKVIELFEKKYPNIKITGEYSGNDGYNDKLAAQIAAGNAPDIMQIGGSFLGEYVTRNAILDLTPNVNSKELDTADFDKGILSSGSYNGKLYGISMGNNAWSLMLNTEMLKKAGIALPKENWTWDDFAKLTGEIASKLGKGYYGAFYDAGNSNYFDVFLKQRGKVMYKDGQIQFTKDDLTAWFNLWEDLRKKGAVTPPEVLASNPSTPDKSLLITGKVAIQMDASNLLTAYQKNTKDGLILLTVPAGDQGNGQFLRPAQFITAYSKTKHPKETVQFIDFYINDPEAGQILGNERGIPESSKIRELLKKDAGPVDLAMYDYSDKISKVGTGSFTELMPGFNEFGTLLKTTSEKISFEQAAVPQAVDQLWDDIQKLLSKYKK